ncbi:MAG: hypothetical protein M1818_007820 [Claussenomyces sp. TS43310]|nr:MAG: hypothetical protein M1818_007820 [Claussenomyces sp. TS43310]
MKTPPVPGQTEDVGRTTNQIPQNNPAARREIFKKITELGLEHMKEKKISMTLLGHEIILQDVVADVAGAVTWAEDYIGDAVKDLPYASIVMVGVSLVLPLLKNPTAVEAANQDGFTYVTSQMRYYVAMESLLLPEDLKLDLKEDLTQRLVDLYRCIIDFQVQSIIRFYRSRTKNFLRGMVKYDDWEKMVEAVKQGDADLISRAETAISATSLNSLKRLVQEAAAIRNSLDKLVDISQNHSRFTQKIERRMSDAENRACLQSLRATDPRLDKKRIEQEKGGLIRDSYGWILSHKEFRRWRDEQKLLWIKGGPGKGKTMLLCGIIDELDQSTTYTCNISFFFCQATRDHINNATAVLRGLLYMLVKQQPSLISYLRNTYDDGKERLEGVNAWVALSEIFRQILEDSNLHNTYLVIDALDECIVDSSLLLDLIAESSSAYSRVKWIVSSRNWLSIDESLHSATKKVTLSLELNKDTVSAAVDIYIKHKVAQLVTKKGYDLKTRDAIQQHLQSNAEDTFLWVALVCENLRKTLRRHALSVLEDSPPGLDNLYRRMIDQIRDSDDAELCKGILAVVSVVYQPVTLDELVCLVEIPNHLSDDESLAETIALCGSFLTLQERTVSFVHQSAKDFLIRQATADIFLSGLKDTHHEILFRSLQLMSKTLRRDIYGLGAPGPPIEQVIRPTPDPLSPARYSCVYWIDHLHNCDLTKNVNDLQDGGSVDKFLRHKYLYWLEALSLVGSMSGHTSQLAKFVHDGYRFIQYHKYRIENAPLQIYSSALLFSPARSIIRNQFQNEEPRWVVIQSAVEDNWSACLQALEGHSSSVNSIAFSHDSKLLASASSDKTVRVWDAATGQALQTLKGHTSSVYSVTFSHDSKLLASASSDKTVQVWDAATGQALQTLEGHSSSVNSIAFSHNSKLLASASSDQTVQVWDAATSQALQTLKGHSSVNSVAFSHDSKLLASASSDKTVQVWDAATGQALQTLKGHSSLVYSVTFSHNSKLLASASDDKTVRVWDAATGQALQTLKGHSSFNSVAFSHNSKLLASASHNKTVQVWDAATGQVLQTLKGHSSLVNSVAFSHNSKLLASASNDKTVRVWDAATGQVLQTLKGHTSSVYSVTFSHDSKLLASVSSDKTVQVWDAATGQALQTLKGHSSFINSVAFSHDSKLLASASYDKTVRVWDAATGQALQTLKGHTSSVYSVTFSHDSKLLASVSSDKMVQVWDAATGQALQTLKGHSSFVNSVAFSHDSKLLASASYDKTVRVWDAATGQALQTLKGHTSSVYSVTFSHDSKLLASASLNQTVRVWDAATGTQQQVFEMSRGEYISTISFDISKSTLITDIGHFKIDGNEAASLPILSEEVDNMNRHQNLGIRESWITWNGQNLLWLPPEFRARTYDVSHTGLTLAIGCSSGKVLVVGVFMEHLVYD